MADLDLSTLTLAKGGHRGPDDGMCLLEAAAYMAGEDWSDHPECVCTVLAAFGRNLNDVLPDDKRQLLVSLLPGLLGTAGDGYAEVRSYMALDWLIREHLPAFLVLTERIPAGVAQSIRDLPPITGLQSARDAGALVRQARDAASAAGDAAPDAVRGAAWDAAPDGVRGGAWDAAWAAARGAAGDAAWAAARGAAGAAAGAAARDAAGDAAWDAAWDAARDVLTPTVALLQDSAIGLYTRMIRVGRSAADA